MKKKYVTALCSFVCAATFCGGFAACLVNEEKAAAETPYTKVACESVSGNSWSADFPLTNAINGDTGDIVALGEWGLTSFFQSEEAMLLTFAEESVIDRLVINYFGGITYTAAWRVEVSNDNQNWARITPKAADGATIYNNEIIQTSSRADTELVIDFDAVSCTYVRLTMVVKQAWGKNCVGGLSEVTAYVSEGAEATAVTYDTVVSYTAEATSVAAGEATSLNDGKNKMFIGDGSGSLVIWEYGTVTFALSELTDVNAVRVYPNGWEVANTTGITDNGDGTYTINEEAFTNNQVASGLKFEGSVDGVTWWTLGEYSGISADIFAHTFDLSSTKAVSYVRMTITGLSLQPHISAYGEIEIYGTEANLADDVSIIGASIRYSDPSGLRFGADISANNYTDLVEVYGEENVQFGMLLYPTVGLNGAELTHNTEYVEDVVCEKVQTLADGTKRIQAVLLNIPAEHNADEITARVYVAITVNGDTTYYYGDTMSDSLSSVATRLLEAGGLTTDEEAFLNELKGGN